MTQNLKDRILEQVDRSDFAGRLIVIAKQIERDFDGAERERLLSLVQETLDRHVGIRENTRRARETLEQLHKEQQTLLQLFEFITARPESQTLH
jgi:hypothetical protein